MTDQSGFVFNRPTCVALCVALSVLFPVTLLASTALSYVWRAEPDCPRWTLSHYNYAIRTFWIVLLSFIPLVLLTLLTFGLAAILFIAMGLWLVVRGLQALMRAQKEEPIPNPTSWLW